MKYNIISWNINGIRAIEKKGFTDWMLNEKPEILCVQETKAQENQIPQSILDSPYKQYYSAAEKKGYSGRGILSSVEPQSVERNFHEERFDREGRILKAVFKDFVLYNVYFPNGKASNERLNYKMDFYGFFLKMMKKHIKRGDKIIICGDVNTAHREIDLARPKENSSSSGFLPEERKWIDLLLETGFHDTFRLFNTDSGQYSWWDYKTKARERNIGWRIDYFFVSNNLKDNLISASILNTITGSDHCPISIELNI